MLLAHAFYYDISLPNEFDSLVHSLQVMAQRWNGEHSANKSNLASKFATRLNHARQEGLQTLDIRVAAYSDNPAGLADTAVNAASHTFNGLMTESITAGQPLGTFGEVLPVAADQGETPDSITLAFPPLPLAFQAKPTSRNHTAMPSPDVNGMNHVSLPQSNLAMPPGMSADSNLVLEDLSFLNYPFLPDQRVSAFSHSIG